MTHPIIHELSSRHTVKHYDSTRTVPSADMEVLLESLRLSVSSINSQPWRFVVIESDEAKQRFSNTFRDKFQFNQKHATTASAIILFAHNPTYTREDYALVVDKGIEDGRTKPEGRDDAFGAYVFVDLNTGDNGDNSEWTKAQTYIAFGNAIHTLARLKIDATSMEGVDSELIAEEFKDELEGHECHVALAIGYSDPEKDYNASLPKSRLSTETVIKRI
ncbi:NAD(P)H-dependent oxidoreductase [Vibrio sp.]|nr:NAD(P)H-dependent oxidoreductase [Vibrio sp.]